MTETAANSAASTGTNTQPAQEDGDRLEGELQALTEGAATILAENGFEVQDTEVQWFSEELWAFIWLAGTGDRLSESRQEDAVQLLESHIETADTDLPTAVNMSCGTAGDSAVAVWL